MPLWLDAINIVRNRMTEAGTLYIQLDIRPESGGPWVDLATSTINGMKIDDIILAKDD